MNLTALTYIWDLLDRSDNIIVTGSTALAYHGLLKMSSAQDIDLRILQPTAMQISKLQECQLADPSNKYIPGGRVNYSFIYHGSKVDVWIIFEPESSELNPALPLFTTEGIRVADVCSIVKHKKDIGRPKDWVQLMYLSSKIFSHAEFNQNLDSIVHKPEGYFEDRKDRDAMDILDTMKSIMDINEVANNSIAENRKHLDLDSQSEMIERVQGDNPDEALKTVLKRKAKRKITEDDDFLN